MEEIEVPLEKVTEDIQEHAMHAQERWVGKVALSAALLAVLAALAALLSGHHSNEAMLDRIKASDGWNQYQAKGIKMAIASTRIELAAMLGKKIGDEEKEKVEHYKKDQEEISARVKEEEASSDAHLNAHQTFAKAVTFYQVAIAICAIAVLTRRRRFWLISLGFGAIGSVFFVLGFLG